MGFLVWFCPFTKPQAGQQLLACEKHFYKQLVTAGMKKNLQTQNTYNSLQYNTGNTRPVAPVTARQAVSDRRNPDPSSVQRSDRYPIPTFFEYRMQAAE
jgi:hypothetical protein